MRQPRRACDPDIDRGELGFCSRYPRRVSVRVRVVPSREQRGHDQAAIVAKIQARLASEGFDEELIVFAYEKKGGAAARAKQQHTEHEKRAERLRSLASAEARAHKRLHEVLGQPKRVGPRRKMSGVPTGRVDWARWKSPACDLVTCDSPFAEVRAHADFCRWLSDAAVRVRRERLRLFGWDLSQGDRWLVEGKGPILVLLHDVLDFSLEDIAVFVRVRVDRGKVPISEDDLANAVKALREVQRVWRREARKMGVAVSVQAAPSSSTADGARSCQGSTSSALTTFVSQSVMTPGDARREHQRPRALRGGLSQTNCWSEKSAR
jgi:hypothetical protein